MALTQIWQTKLSQKMWQIMRNNVQKNAQNVQKKQQKIQIVLIITCKTKILAQL